MSIRKKSLLYLLLAISTSLFAQNPTDTLVQQEEDVLFDKNFIDLNSNYNIQAQSDQIIFTTGDESNGNAKVIINGQTAELILGAGIAVLELEDINRKGQLFKFDLPNGKHKKLYHISLKKDGSLRVKHIPLALSIIPPLLAILLALVFKEVILSLFVGIFSGAFIVGGLRFEAPLFYLESMWMVLQKYILDALTDSGHLSIILVSLLIGGMVAIISRNGGMAGVVSRLSKYAKNDTSTQLVTWL